MANARFGVDILANDKTAKGVISAQKNIGSVVRAANDAGKASDRAAASLGRFGGSGGLGSIVRTMGAVEKATSSAFGGASPISAAITKLGVIGEAASAMGTGFGEAAAGAGILGGAMGAVGVIAGATAGAISAAAVAGFKLDGSFVNSAASLGRLSNMLGIATKDLQQFQGAGERVGVSKEAVMASIATANQAIYDGVRGSNAASMNMMTYMGIKAQRKKDGSLDTAAMMLDISDAAARQKSPNSRRQVLDAFGMGGAAYALFSQGSRRVRADMADVGKHGVVLSDGAISTALRQDRNGVIRSQLVDRHNARHNETRMGVWAGAKDMLTSAATTLSDLGEGRGSLGGVISGTFAPAAGRIETAAGSFERGAAIIVSRTGGIVSRAGGGIISGAHDLIAANSGKGWRDRFVAMGLPEAAASGLAANIMAESKGRFNSVQVGRNGGTGPGYGLAQWEHPRQRDFAAWAGHDIGQSTEDEQIRFIMHELFGPDGSKRAVGARLLKATTAREAAEILTRDYEGPADKHGQAIYRGNLAEKIDRPVHVVLEVHGMPPGSSLKAKSGQSVAIAHAMP